MRTPFLALALAALAASASAAEADWRTFVVEAGGRKLAAAMPARSGPVLTVVIEGDGAAHDADGRPAADPTPRRPTGLAIARGWPGPVAWLGRLCQQVRAQDPACTPADWTTHRYSEAAVRAADTAVDELKARAGAGRVVLVGWSGGGVVAALVAARRRDVAALVTIAAPLDVGAWAQARGLSPLSGSLDPGELAPLSLPQAHLFGAFDPVVPPATAVKAARRLGGAAAVVEVWNERHACCWARRAKAIARLASAASGHQPALAEGAELGVGQDHPVVVPQVDDDVSGLLTDAVAGSGR